MRRARAAERALRFEDLSTDNPLLVQRIRRNGYILERAEAQDTIQHHSYGVVVLKDTVH